MIQECENLMQQVVINTRYGGRFGLSDEAIDRLIEDHGFVVYDYDNAERQPTDPDIIIGDMGSDQYRVLREDLEYRNNPAVIAVVEDMGDNASDAFAELTVAEIPDDVEWEIVECNGKEWVAEAHRRWSG